MFAPAAARCAGRRCLVTGGLGFIGANLAVALAHAGAHVTVVDGLIERHGGGRHNLVGADGIDVILADLVDASAYEAAAAEAEFVFNLAGQVSHVDSMTDPLGDLHVNTTGHVVLLELLRRLNPTVPVVYASTRQIYGRVQYRPVDEEHPVHPVDVNGIDKYAGEQFHTLYAQVHGMRASALRLTNIYGPRQRILGDHHGFIGTFIRRALRNESITLFGDGSQERDVLYVRDAVEAFVLAATTEDAVGEVFNIGHPNARSLRDIADVIVGEVGNGQVVLEPWPDERKKIDIGSYSTDCSKAKRILGWEAETSLETGMRDTIAFIRDHEQVYL
ncbi:MAG: NAD-dependent epimerase/dehydratase family protein [Acidimicrobiia bacterium]